MAHKTVELRQGTNSRDAYILSAYIFAFVEQLPSLMLRGDKASTEEEFIKFMHRNKFQNNVIVEREKKVRDA